MTRRSSDAGGNAAERLRPRHLVGAGVDRAADAHAARLDQMIQAETDATVLADRYGRNGVVDFGALEALHDARLLEPEPG